MVNKAILILVIMSGRAVGQTGWWLIGLGVVKILRFIKLFDV